MYSLNTMMLFSMERTAIEVPLSCCQVCGSRKVVTPALQRKQWPVWIAPQAWAGQIPTTARYLGSRGPSESRNINQLLLQWL